LNSLSLRICQKERSAEKHLKMEFLSEVYFSFLKIWHKINISAKKFLENYIF